MLRKFAFIIAIFGVAFLVGLVVFPDYVSIDEELISELVVGEKVFLEGFVVKERDFGDFRILKLSAIKGGAEMNFDVLCDCKNAVGTYLDKEIRAEGVVEEFNGKKQVRILRVRTG